MDEHLDREISLLNAYHPLTAWLAARQTDIRVVVVIGMSLDGPAATPSEDCRYEAGVRQRPPSQAACTIIA
jgi:DNA gyrase inhibitor GyrI